MRNAAALLIALLACEASWAQANRPLGVSRARMGQSVVAGPVVVPHSAAVVYPSYGGYGYRSPSRQTLSVNGYPHPYTVGRGEWLPKEETVAAPVPRMGPDGWNWSRVDLPTLAAMVRENRGR